MKLLSLEKATAVPTGVSEADMIVSTGTPQEPEFWRQFGALARAAQRPMDRCPTEDLRAVAQWRLHRAAFEIGWREEDARLRRGENSSPSPSQRKR